MGDTVSERLEMRAEGGGAGHGYYLAGRRLKGGEALEVWTPLGWLRGRLQWSGHHAHSPTVTVPVGEGEEVPLSINLFSGTRCRRAP